MSDKDPRSDGRMVFLAAASPVMLASGRRKAPLGLMVIVLVVAAVVAIWAGVSASGPASHPAPGARCADSVTGQSYPADPAYGGNGCQFGDELVPPGAVPGPPALTCRDVLGNTYLADLSGKCMPGDATVP